MPASDDVLRIENFGPIRGAEVAFGDLTVLIGQQAIGKSIALQLLKLLVDERTIVTKLRRAGAEWEGELNNFLDLYFGEGLHSLWEERTQIFWRGERRELRRLAADTKGTTTKEKLFFVPAQRVLTLRGGWPQAFNLYSPGDPFTVRDFSEELRVLVSEFDRGTALFPQQGRFKETFRALLSEHIFGGFDLKIDTEKMQRRLILSRGEGEPLPYMVWSAGQREFVPLLLGLYWLMPPTKAPRRGGIEWVVIEEIEMGLHPRAVSVLLLMTLELVSRGYRVCLSTHAPQVLETLWALRKLQENEGTGQDVLDVFGLPSPQQRNDMKRVGASVLRKELRAYFFDRVDGRVQDISALTLDSVEGDDGWGGLLEPSNRVNEVVARVVARASQ